MKVFNYLLPKCHHPISYDNVATGINIMIRHTHILCTAIKLHRDFYDCDTATVSVISSFEHNSILQRIRETTPLVLVLSSLNVLVELFL